MILEEQTKTIVATAMCLHNYKGSTPFWGNLGWLACDPSHTGKGLGIAVSAAVILLPFAITIAVELAGWLDVHVISKELCVSAICGIDSKNAWTRFVGLKSLSTNGSVLLGTSSLVGI